MKNGIIFLIVLSGFLIAQDLKYERKSISYANVILVSDPSIKIEAKQADYMIKKFRSYIEMPRFDYNPIPEELLNEFKSEVEARGTSLSLDDVVEILKQKFVPKIIEILDIEKEMRAQNLLTEAQRNSFIATKAKSLGITAEQLMKIMNSAFIYIPMISKYKVYTDNVNQLHTVEIIAGAIWYRVIYSEEGENDLKLVVKKEAKGVGVAKIGKEFKHEGVKVKDIDYAFRTAVVALARDLQVATRDIPEFRLGAQVTEVYSNAVSFPMGTKEGIKIDDGFDLVELQEDPNGGIIRKKIGFVRVTRVANNRLYPRTFSRAQIIIGRGIEPGVYVSERPRLPIDLVVRLMNNPFTVNSGQGTSKMIGYSIHAELIYNFGRNINVNQLWIGAGLFIGSGNSGELEGIKDKFQFYLGTDKPNVTIFGLNGVLIKKFYFRRLSVIGRAELITEGITFYKSNSDESLAHSSLGLGFGLGVEYVATPDLNLGFSLGYRTFSESEEWDFNGLTYNIATGNHSGVVFSLCLNYSLPKLGFDPIAVIKGAVGW